MTIQLFADVFVFDGHQTGQHLQDGDLGAKTAKDRGELAAYGTGTDDAQRLGYALQIEDFDVGEDKLGVRSETGDHARAGAGGNDDLLAFDDLVGAVGRGHFHASGASQTAVSRNHVHLVLLHQELDALSVFGDNLPFARHHLGIVQTRILAFNALFLAMQKRVPYVGRVQ